MTIGSIEVLMKPPRCLVVKALRLAVGDTQQQFATRMGWGISSVVRYETCRTIKGAALIKMERLAHKKIFDDFSELLRDCIRKDCGIEDALFARMVADVDRKKKR